MTHEVIRWQIVIDYVGYPNWTQFRYIVLYLDDATDALSVKIRDGSDNPVETPTSGPPLFSGSNGTANRITPPPFYQYCDGTDLKYLQEINTFPYAALATSVNDSQCQIAPVCDLEISSEYTTEDATAPDEPDGEIQVYATSSNGVIKYSLTADFDYASATNTSGLFASLLPGTYTIYAKDEIGCTDSIDIIVKVTTEYGVRYRGEYHALDPSNPGNNTRIDIAQRGYEDSTTEICFSGTPFILDYDRCDKYTTLVASHCVIELLEEEEDGFLDLFTNDDRKYRIDYYKFLGGGWVLMWQGYVVPEFYQKPFVRDRNNYVTVKASDQLGLLKDEPFVDASENHYRDELSQLKIVCEILKKTDLNLLLRVQDNIFEENMATDQSPLEQAYVDMRIFYDSKNVPHKCDKVHQKNVNCKSLRLFQARGYWWLVRAEYNIGEFTYFEYNLDGEIQGAEENALNAPLDVVLQAAVEYNPVKNRVTPNNSTGIFWVNASQLELFETNYGKFELTHTLGFDDNMIDEGRFEEEDVIDLSGGNKGFKNWSINLLQSGVKTGLEFVENGDSKGAFFMDFNTASGNQADNILYSTEINLEANVYGPSNRIKFKFQYMGVPYYKIPWILLRWEVRYTSALDSSEYFLRDTGLPNTFSQWTADPDLRFNEVYIDKFDKFETLEFIKPVLDIHGGTIRIAFYMHNHAGRDALSEAELKAIDTVDLEVGKRVIAYNVGGDEFTEFYELEDSNDADDVPNAVRPDDWVHSGDPNPNPKVWKLKGRIFQGGNVGLVYKFLIDNVKFTYIPFDGPSGKLFNPPTTVTYDLEVNRFNKEVYEEEFLLGDLPEIQNAKDLYRGYLRLEDGTPTSLWYRNGVEESKKLLLIARDDRAEQLKNIQKRLQVDIHQRGEYYAFVDCLAYDSRRFLNAKYVLNDVKNIITLEAIQMTTGADGEPPVETGAFSTAYSEDYDTA